MENFTLQSQYFHVVVLLLCIILCKLSVPAIHSNPFKMPITESYDGLLYFLINDAG